LNATIYFPQILARKNLQKIIAAGEGRAKRKLEKVLNRKVRDFSEKC